MKNMKKLFAMVLAVMLVMSLATAAFAADTTFTITAPSTTHQYEIYQIFTGDLKDGVLSNVKWGVNGTGTTGTAVPEDTLTTLVGLTGTESQQLETIDDYVTLSNPVATITNGQTYEADAGYYLIKDKAGTVSGVTDDAYTLYIVKVSTSFTISPKGGIPSVDKVIVEGNTVVEENEASIGDTITYKFTGTLPSNLDDYKAYFYKFIDSMTKGLTYTGNLTVEVNDVDVTKYFYSKATTSTDADNVTTTKLVVGIANLLALENVDGVGDITANSKVVVTYTAKLNESAFIASANVNAVKLMYSNDPNNEGAGTTDAPPEEPGEEPVPSVPTGVTAVDYVYTYTTEITLTKNDDKSHILPGAAFKISGEGVNVVVTTGQVYVENNTEGTYYKLTNGTYTTEVPTEANKSSYASTDVKYVLKTNVAVDTKAADAVDYTAFVDETTGQVKFTGLGAGTYTITEIVTPDGYNTIAPFTVTIGWEKTVDANKDDVAGCAWTYTWSNDAENTTNSATVVNKAGSTLPETGGMGTTIFYIVGALLAVVAVVLLITKKRMANAQ